MAWPASKRHFLTDEFRAYVATLAWTRWRPTMIVLHNTAAPTLAQWKETEVKDRAAGHVPGTARINSLESFFRDQQHWSGCPHLFIADDLIWEMNPLTAPGVHSPSWNGVAIGIEMVADFDKEDDDAGPGLVVRQNAIYATALLCSTLGLDPRTAVHLHKDDPKTTHACPGEDFAQDRAQVVEQIVALMDGGEHDPHALAVAIGARPPEAKPEGRGVVQIGDLNVRKGPGVTNPSIGKLPKGCEVAVIDRASNGSTGWLKVRSPAGYIGWVAGSCVAISA